MKLIEDFKKGELKKTYKSGILADMKNIPNARLDLMDDKKNMLIGVIHATRGCPYNCYFCSVTNFFGRRYRFRPISKVIEEIKSIMSKNLAGPGNSIIFNDDNIACNKKYAKELYRALKELKIKWSSQTDMSIAEDDEFRSVFQFSTGKRNSYR